LAEKYFDSTPKKLLDIIKWRQCTVWTQLHYALSPLW